MVIDTVIPLAAGQINAVDQLRVDLVRAIETPTAILIRWPHAPSVADPRLLAEVVGAAIAILTEAQANLARTSADERRNRPF